MTEPHLSRRKLLGLAAASAAAASANPALAARPKASFRGNINQSVVWWCFALFGEKWDIETMSKVAVQLGCKSIELAGPDLWPTMKKHGLTCAICPNGMSGPPFMKGLNNLDWHEEVIANTTKMIDASSDFGCPNVIAFNGFKWKNPDDPTSGEIPLDVGAKNCVTGLKKLARHAEKKNVTVCIEHLNSRHTGDNNRGHPGYQGDDLDYVADIVKQVGSPNVKILFDIYHVQIMNGDIIRRIEQYHDLIGHIHTAGNPGRGELDDKNEINYPPIMRKLLEVGYKGFVGQEFIPTRDPRKGLEEAVRQCDV